MKIKLLCVITLLLIASCEQQERKVETPPYGIAAPQPAPAQPSLANTLMHAAVGGAAAGAGASAGHALTQGAIKSYQTRKRARNIAKIRARRK